MPKILWVLMIFATHGWAPAETYMTRTDCEKADAEHGADLSAHHLVEPNHKCVKYLIAPGYSLSY